MKKLIFATTLLLGFSTLSFAQGAKKKLQNSTPEQRAEMMTAALTKKLDLTEDQKLKVYAVNLDRAKQMKSLKAENDLKGSKTQIRDSFKGSDDKIIALLNESQRKTYSELKAERQTKMEERKDKKGGSKAKKVK